MSVALDLPSGAPTLQASCADPNSGSIADPAVRLTYFLEQFPSRNTVTSICNNDLSPALTQIAETLTAVVGNP